MKQVLLSAILAGAAAGAGGAMLVAIVQHPGQPAPGPIGTVASEGVQSLREELAELRRDNRLLLDRVRYLEERPVEVASTRTSAVESVTPVTIQELERRIASIDAAFDASPGQVSPLIRSTVSEALQSIREEEERQREIEREARRLERIDQRITDLSATLGLDSFQARQMREVLLAETTRREEFMRTVRDGGDWTGGREGMQRLREEVEQSLARILSPAQLEQYQEHAGAFFGAANQRGRGGAPQQGRGGRGGGRGGATETQD